MNTLIPNHDTLLDDYRLRYEREAPADDPDTTCTFCDGTHDERDCEQADGSVDEELWD